ncbi:MAG: hypothetical protein IKP38_08160 [Clostridia bacterium]|nr:hypothetical protein [Clostridia bacterium]
MVVMFCGHKEISEPDKLRRWLEETVETLIQRGSDTFYLGGYGAFDRLAANVVWSKKRLYPSVQSVLVLPYLDRAVDATDYDGTIYPPLENVPRRFAISRRNEWMVDHSDVVVAYVIHEWGGAATTLRYAKRKHKEIIL